jgi:hypothetical protein
VHTYRGALTAVPPFDFNQSLRFTPAQGEQRIVSGSLTKAVILPDGEITVFWRSFQSQEDINRFSAGEDVVYKIIAKDYHPYHTQPNVYATILKAVTKFPRQDKNNNRWWVYR